MPSSPGLFADRDTPFIRGRPKGGGTTYFIIPGILGVGGNTKALTNGTDNYAPFFVDSNLVVDQLVFEVSTAGSAGVTSRVGLYAADKDWQPIGAPLADSGTIATDTTGVKTYTPTNPIYLRRGRYLSVGNSSAATAPIVRALQISQAYLTTLGSSLTISSYTVARAYAAFPTPGTAWTTTAGAATPAGHFLFFRVATP